MPHCGFVMGAEWSYLNVNSSLFSLLEYQDLTSSVLFAGDDFAVKTRPCDGDSSIPLQEAARGFCV